MNVGITGDIAEGEIWAVILPCPDDGSITFTSESKGPVFPLDMTREMLDKLRECGALAVAAILAKPASSLSDFERVLLRGIHWFGNALPQPEPENVLLSLVTCLETFLTPRDGNPIAYALNNWEALRCYTKAGFLAIDNNVAEREMKRIAIGRKNWLTVGSPRGGQTEAVLFSFTSTCQRLGVEPWAYLHDVLTRLPTTSVGQLGNILPDHWQAARRGKMALPADPASIV